MRLPPTASWDSQRFLRTAKTQLLAQPTWSWSCDCKLGEVQARGQTAGQGTIAFSRKNRNSSVRAPRSEHFGYAVWRYLISFTLCKHSPARSCEAVILSRFGYGTNFHLPEDADLVTMSHPAMLPTINIGETIRNYRLQKGMSQGDIEKRTGLLRCYLSRVETGHSNGAKGLPQLSDDEVRFLSQVRRYATNLNESDRKLVLAMVKKMASNSKPK